MIKPSFYMLDIYLEKWITDPLIQVMLEVDTQTNELW